ncbi:MAG: N-acetylmuramoyl-L-alanine amidase [Xylanivirga thermophila]|jgi:N-acetylmuramoyl-L-alanine amidase|uniref:cell wall hydrolase n=1 Tax=Xylanivirga thermophila TaxID=2496273 RepID=UPI00101DB01B|nr:cell wall hydrolase [Xylanivirga thermophila]
MQGSRKRMIMIMLVITIVFMSAMPALAADRLLKVGVRGDDVSRVQQRLKDLGYYKYYKVTGYYGPITRQAVIDFQRANGLAADGIVGPNTSAKLYNNKTNTTNRASTDRSSPDIYWLSRIIHAEACGESYVGKVAVGNVILNRVKSSAFPNTIYNVVFEYYGGIPQFSPVADGSIYNTPNSESIRAAQDAYNGSRPVGDALYFFNPAKAEGKWIVNNKTYVAKIGQHAFYR